MIPKWGSANATRAFYPFGKTDGIYWPVVQPYDNVNLADERQCVIPFSHFLGKILHDPTAFSLEWESF